MSQAEETPTSTRPEMPAQGPIANVVGDSPLLAAPLLMGVKLPIRVLLGTTQLTLRDITQLGNGSVGELNCAPNDPVQIMVNDRVIAHGEVVVVAGNYGVRITKIATREDKVDEPGPQNDLLRFSEKLK